MRLRAVRVVDAPVEQVRAALREPERWPSWVPGLAQVTALPRGPGKHEVELRLRGPRVFRARLEVTAAEEGVRFDLIEGDASALQGGIRADATAEGTVAAADLEIVFPVAVPGALMAELELVLPRWLASL